MGFDRSTWLVPLFLICGVLLPTGCVLWFMNDAAASQAVAARQSVAEAYRDQLPLMRDRVEAYWQTRASELSAKAGAGSAADFAHAVRAGLADAVIYLSANGSTLYPTPIPPLHPTANSAELLQVQAQIGRLAQAGNKDKALQVIQENFISGPLARATDSQGRLVAADEQLLALKLLSHGDGSRGDKRFSSVLQRLTSELTDYDHVSMPSAQRLFLMDEVRALEPAAEFPTLEAERLAAQYLETNSLPKETWKLDGKLASKSGRVVALYRTSTILAGMREFIDQQSPSRSVRFDLLPPDAAAAGAAIDAGASLPGWRISFALLDTKAMDAAARARKVSYLWGGFLAIGVMTLMGGLAGNIFRRQMRLARLKTDLVAAVSHELRTPLASMRLLVDTLLDETHLEPKKTREYLRLIAGENDRLTRLIENFLTFSRIERNRQRFEFAPVPPESLIGTAAGLMKERLHTQACHFEVEAAPGLPLIDADEDALITVLLNLIDNAYKYTPENKEISVRAYHAGGEIVFEVADNGIGIAPRDQKRIFRRFYRVDQRLARETEGCGLGLSIVEFIVKAHRGTVTVKSRSGAGSTFIVRIPCAAQAREAAA